MHSTQKNARKYIRIKIKCLTIEILNRNIVKYNKHFINCYK